MGRIGAGAKGRGEASSQLVTEEARGCPLDPTSFCRRNHLDIEDSRAPSALNLVLKTRSSRDFPPRPIRPLQVVVSAVSCAGANVRLYVREFDHRIENSPGRAARRRESVSSFILSPSTCQEPGA